MRWFAGDLTDEMRLELEDIDLDSDHKHVYKITDEDYLMMVLKYNFEDLLSYYSEIGTRSQDECNSDQEW